MKKVSFILVLILFASCKQGEKKEGKNENPWVTPTPVVSPSPQPTIVPPSPSPKPSPVVTPKPSVPSYACVAKSEASIDCYAPHKDIAYCQYFKDAEDLKKAAELAKGPDCILVDGEMIYNGFGPCMACKKMIQPMKLKKK